MSREELECRSLALARDAPFFYSLIINPSFLLSAHSFQASIKVQAERRRNSRRKGRETEARLTSSFPFCSIQGADYGFFLPNAIRPCKSDSCFVVNRSRSMLFPCLSLSKFLRLAKFPRLGFYHDEHYKKKERDRSVGQNSTLSQKHGVS